MRNFLLFLTIGLLLAVDVFPQDLPYRKYSYTEFFQLISAEKDSVFTLNDALIVPDKATDQRFISTPHVPLFDDPHRPSLQDSIVVDKIIRLHNVQFGPHAIGDEIPTYVHHIHFKKPVTLTNVSNMLLASSTFDDLLSIEYTDAIQGIIDQTQKTLNQLFFIQYCDFKNGFRYAKQGVTRDSKVNLIFGLAESSIETRDSYILFINQYQSGFVVRKNRFKVKDNIYFEVYGADYYAIEENRFDTHVLRLEMRIPENSFFSLYNNDISDYTALYPLVLPHNVKINWSQFHNRLIAESELYPTLVEIQNADPISERSDSEFSKKYLDAYYNKVRVEEEYRYKEEQKLKGQFISLYRAQNDIEYANQVYIASKELETQRLAYRYRSTPQFKTYFAWKINQFLDVFSAYGTEPARAIVFSMYVILIFALIYLFFPNYWDSHGKSRVMDRYRFFLTYANQDSGMHEVFLKDKEPQLLASEEFKAYLEEKGKTAPKFFLATALPLYRWSVAGTKTVSWLLSKADILKGKWSDTAPKKKRWKAALLITAFLIALLYDVMIKVLNALMLSINTFTTLGFGEIPIKGLPRYLAIIQGFIGWFMLTIFSVSLISQLLN